MPMITIADVRAAAARIAGQVVRTPALRSDVISRVVGADVTLKLENLQATGAFKERGAANRLALLTAEERKAGVIAMSAGNHAQAVARHAMLSQTSAVIVMPKHTPATKVTRTASWGARVVLHGDTLAEAAAWARRDVALAAITMSENGSMVIQGGDTALVEAVATQVIDTTGAGDAYAAGFLAALAAGKSIKQCGTLGSIAAAEIISHFGARPQRDLSQELRKLK